MMIDFPALRVRPDIALSTKNAVGRHSHPPMNADASSGQPDGQPRRGTSRPRRNGAGTDNADGSSGRRKACNECKQQKLRCDLTYCDTTNLPVCSRCNRLGLECKIELGFRRTRKRRRSVDLVNEIRDLKKRLEEAQDGSNTNPTLETAQTRPTSEMDWALPATAGGLLPTPSVDANLGQLQLDSSRSTVPPMQQPPPPPIPVDESPTATTDATEHSRAPGLTTRPVIDEPGPHRRFSSSRPRPQALGNTALSVEEIEELFNIYRTSYHPHMPVIDINRSPQEYYHLSELLFWTIISVASRRLSSHPTLLPKLARSVTDLMWKTLRSVSYSITTVQALALLCTWPFPTSSSTADPTFMLVGTMLQIGTQIGLHRALSAQDFSKVPIKLEALEYAEWVRTWEACNIVAQSVSVGCGLPIFVQTHDGPSSVTQMTELSDSPAPDLSLVYRRRVEQFRLRVSSSLERHVPEDGDGARADERLTLYRLLNMDLADLECECGPERALNVWYLTAAKLHLHASYLLDDATTDGYKDRIITLYLTAQRLIELSIDKATEKTGFCHYCPFFCYQVFTCAAFVVLKILMNGYFRSIIDVSAGTKNLEAAIAALRKISVVNNDLPARLGDVIGFFCALPDTTVVGGVTIDDLRLRQVKNRMSMSVV
ncbi:Zn(2)-C6 fungal-type domain-containing protein [Fusarium keratoplasticum]|nr:Zn(2)-C6 fungal-type domain-containing protein [Fusarium keratoplasticum]